MLISKFAIHLYVTDLTLPPPPPQYVENSPERVKPPTNAKMRARDFNLTTADVELWVKQVLDFSSQYNSTS